MATQYGGYIPLNRTRIKSIQPCESCGYRKAKVKVSLKLGPANNEQVMHRLCDRCDPKQ